MADPVIVQCAPFEVDLEEGKTYFWCTCGRSAKQPFCDGTHKGSEFKSLPFVAEKSGKSWLCGCKHAKTSPFCDGTHLKLKSD